MRGLSFAAGLGVLLLACSSGSDTRDEDGASGGRDAGTASGSAPKGATSDVSGGTDSTGTTDPNATPLVCEGARPGRVCEVVVAPIASPSPVTVTVGDVDVVGVQDGDALVFALPSGVEGPATPVVLHLAAGDAHHVLDIAAASPIDVTAVIDELRTALGTRVTSYEAFLQDAVVEGAIPQGALDAFRAIPANLDAQLAALNPTQREDVARFVHENRDSLLAPFEEIDAIVAGLTPFDLDRDGCRNSINQVRHALERTQRSVKLAGGIVLAGAATGLVIPSAIAALGVLALPLVSKINHLANSAACIAHELYWPSELLPNEYLSDQPKAISLTAASRPLREEDVASPDADVAACMTLVVEMRRYITALTSGGAEIIFGEVQNTFVDLAGFEDFAIDVLESNGGSLTGAFNFNATELTLTAVPSGQIDGLDDIVHATIRVRARDGSLIVLSAEHTVSVGMCDGIHDPPSFGPLPPQCCNTARPVYCGNFGICAYPGQSCANYLDCTNDGLPELYCHDASIAVCDGLQAVCCGEDEILCPSPNLHCIHVNQEC